MMRRVLMVCGTFLLLLLAYGVYRAVTDVKSGNPRRGQPATSPVARVTGSSSQPSPEEGVWLNIEARDKDGRLEGIYRAASWRRHTDGSITLQKPDITLYQPGGEQVHINADTGELYGAGLTRSGLSIEDVKNQKTKMVQRGRLLGGQEPVRIDIIRDASRPDQTISIRTPDLDINNDLLQIMTEHEVEVRSAEADMFGTGLTLQWDSNPEELRQMRIEHGQKMVIYNVPDAMKITPGASGGENGSATIMPMADDGYPRPASRPTSRSSTASAPAKRTRFMAEFVDTAGKLKVDSPDARLDGADKLTLVFNWDSDSQSKKSASSSAKSQPGSGPAAGGAPKGKAAGVDKTAAKTPASKPATAPAKAPMVITWDGPLVVRPVPAEWLKERYATIKALNEDRGTSYASFEEVPSPAYGEKSQRKDYWMSAVGKRLTLGDRDTTAWCSRFVFESIGEVLPRQTGSLEGTKADPVRLDMAGRGSTICPLVTFDRGKGIADLIGSGTMTMSSSDLDFSVAAASKPTPAGSKIASTAASAPAGVQTIAWSGTVHVNFAEQRGPDGRLRQAINNAQFRQAVRLKDETADGKTNFIDCDNLDVTIVQSKLSPKFRQMPQLAHAWGAVKARQDASDINCDDLEVTFEEERMVDAGKERIRSKPVLLKASGTQDKYVEVTDLSDPADPVKAYALKLTSNPDARSANLDGTDAKKARIEQGGNYVTGKTIHVDNALTKSSTYRRTWLNVVGAGEARFMADRDFQDNKLAAARPVIATWSDSMDYEGYPIDDRDNNDNLRLYGNVQLTSDTETMDCGQMTVFFERPVEQAKVLPLDPLAKGKVAAATKPVKQRRMIDVEGLSKKSIKKIEAKKGVDLASEKRDEKGNLLQAISVSGEALEYAIKRKPVRFDSMGLPLPPADPDRTIQMLGGGVMTSEDYRPADPKETEAASSNSMRLARPSQTVFKWTKHMEWVQASEDDPNARLSIAGTQPSLRKSSTVTLTGEVQMTHVSGDKIIKDKLQSVVLPATLPSGRDFRIEHCNQMIANFGPPPEKAKSSTRPSAASEPAAFDASAGLGELERFIAVRDVVLRDGATEIDAQQVQYDKAKPPVRPGQETFDLMRIWGFLGDEKPANASLHYEDVKTGRPVKPVISQYIECSLKEGRIIRAQAKDVSSGTR